MDVSAEQRENVGDTAPQGRANGVQDAGEWVAKKGRGAMSTRSDRSGVSLPEVVLVAVILGVVGLVVVMRLPRQVEVARRAGCQKNLMHIGVALVIYDQVNGRLPAVPELNAEASRRTSPLKLLLEALAVPDLREVSDPQKPPDRVPGFAAREQPVPGFLCLSDRSASAQGFAAPVSYRANAGDTPDGRHGVFSPGRTLSLAQVQDGDGVEFTAAFSERLVGTSPAGRSRANFAQVSGPITGAACPPLDKAVWKGDAGASWFGSNWQSTLYQHALTPNAGPSCLAADELTAQMGASSAHLGSVNVLLLDGSVRPYRETVDPQVWRRLATPTGSDADADTVPATKAASPPGA